MVGKMPKRKRMKIPGVQDLMLVSVVLDCRQCQFQSREVPKTQKHRWVHKQETAPTSKVWSHHHLKAQSEQKGKQKMRMRMRMGKKYHQHHYLKEEEEEESHKPLMEK
ncbi:hypothetical protein TcCL_NonESM11293 [Trypanosoma cruzi]|nr:hypothetical protein TcCL_NonESM11293 [Trypanosoma cruzi]